MLLLIRINTLIISLNCQAYLDCFFSFLIYSEFVCSTDGNKHLKHQLMKAAHNRLLFSIMSSFSQVEQEEEKTGLLNSPGSIPRQSSYYKKRSSRLCYTVAFLSLVVAALTSALVVVSSRIDTHKHDALPPWVPPQQQISKTFWPEDVFGREPSKETEEAWDSLFPGMPSMPVLNT